MFYWFSFFSYFVRSVLSSAYLIQLTRILLKLIPYKKDTKVLRKTIIYDIINIYNRKEKIMSIAKCKECGNEISSTAEVCPKCGYMIKKENNKEKMKQFKTKRKNEASNVLKKLKEKCKKHKLFVSIIAVFILIIIFCVIYRICFFNAYNQAKKYSKGGYYTLAYNEIKRFPIVLGGKEIKDAIKEISIKSEFGNERAFAESCAESYSEFLSYKEVEENFKCGIGDLYEGLKKSIDYEAKDNKAKNIKNEFITFYYYNLYRNVKTEYIEENFIKEVNETLDNYDYEAFSKKMERVSNAYISRSKLKLKIYNPPSNFYKKLFDSNMEFHYPKVDEL